ncbi:MAG: flagellar assembly protein FliW [Chloroflexi bacterium]|nr:flagellar assembly protein FliW [Chloroflexota bacterium]
MALMHPDPQEAYPPSYEGPRTTVTFADGLVGAPDWRNFVLDMAQEHYPIGVLECLDAPDVRFLVVDPWQLWPDYQAPLDAETLQQVGAAEVADLLVLTTLRVAVDGSQLTVNLLGPLVVHRATGAAIQIVLYDSGYGTQHQLPLPQRARLQAALKQ